MDFVKITLATFERIMRVVKEVEGIRGSGVQRIPGVGIVIRQTPAPPRRQAFDRAEALVPVRIIGPSTCGGLYQARIIKLALSGIDLTADTFSAADVGDTDANPNIIVANLAEQGTMFHGLYYIDGSKDHLAWPTGVSLPIVEGGVVTGQIALYLVDTIAVTTACSPPSP